MCSCVTVCVRTDIHMCMCVYVYSVLLVRCVYVQLVKVKKLTIEILMAVTDSEMSAVAEEVMREMRTPRTSRWDVKAEPTQQTRSEQGNAQRRRKTPEGPNKILCKSIQPMLFEFVHTRLPNA